jgi:murein DD-endopeptidase MepM/ murein hydrolase activator NlpD
MNSAKRRDRLSPSSIIDIMISEENPLREKPASIFGEVVKYRPDEGYGGLLAVFGASRKRWDKDSKEMVRHIGKEDLKSHRGVDISVPEGGYVRAPYSGTITKIGQWYPGDPDTKYVQITTDNNYTFRFAYVDPGENIKEGSRIAHGQPFGVMKRPTSEAAGWDKSISDHIHIEAVKGKEWVSKDRFDPSQILGVTE